MARIRQYFPRAYTSAGVIDSEFENVIRYLNAAEIGDNTIGELLDKLFDDSGEVDMPIEMRMDAVNGLQYRVGVFDQDDEGWQTITTADAIRGAPGSNVGLIEGPVFFNRVDIAATANQTEFPYVFSTDAADVIVYIEGVLQAAADYVVDKVNGKVTLSAQAADTDVTIISVRSQESTAYIRNDYISAANQAVFAFVYENKNDIIVFRNGILQQEGAGNDYSASPENDTITFLTVLPSGDKVSILQVDNSSLKQVNGLMTEDKWTDLNGYIPYAKLSVEDGDIPLVKVATLATELPKKANLYKQGTTPVDASLGDLWVDTSQTPNMLKFYDGTQWLLTSPSSIIPDVTAANAYKFIRINATGTGLEYATVDLSSVVALNDVGVANGVASLDSTGKLPVAQLPDVYTTMILPYYNAGAVVDGNVFLATTWKQLVRLDGCVFKLAVGSCTVQLVVDGNAVGSLIAVNTGQQKITFAPIIEIDSTVNPKRLELQVSGSADTPSGLEVAFTGAALSA